MRALAAAKVAVAFDARAAPSRVAAAGEVPVGSSAEMDLAARISELEAEAASRATVSCDSLARDHQRLQVGYPFTQAACIFFLSMTVTGPSSS
jgi:hypothetical protein